jgi:adenine-specific DNA-methyltransferase
MRLNAEDDGNRQYICVQLPEVTDPASEAYKAGYKTIFDITKARIEKAAAKIKEEKPLYIGDLGFKIYETVPMPDKYQDAPEELTANLELFNAGKLTHTDRHSLLRTWALQDNVPLTMDFMSVDLAGYTAYQVKHLLYFVEPDITLDAVIKLLEQLDNNPDFKPSRLIVFGYLLESKVQREMSEAVKHYNNRKGIELTLDIRY